MYVDPGRFTMNLKMDPWKTSFFYKPMAFRFHVGLFQGLISGHIGLWITVDTKARKVQKASKRIHPPTTAF